MGTMHVRRGARQEAGQGKRGREHPGLDRGGFTLTELMVVVGLIALLVSLLMPAITKARAAAQASVCLSNLRQMGTAWQLYTAENKGRLPENVVFNVASPDLVYRGNWLGILDSYLVRGETLLCPSAREPISFVQPNKGFGNVVYAWNGKLTTVGSLVRLSPTIYRVGSYGYNKNLTVNGPFGTTGRASKLNSVRSPCEVPVIIDAVAAEVQPTNYSEMNPAPAPPNLNYDDVPLIAPDHWKFLIARHGRAVNSYMADGSARRVPLEETYRLIWSGGWMKYRLALPAF